ncbi:protein kinase domain-containing protein [Gimesia sp.]|uniref:protein kinase domain-containing protein n=1 Tax=Gimesia sp. TaxID=2024833 RepID=UPI003A920C8A
MTEQEIFNEALEIDDVQSRSAFLDQVCGDDQLLRKQVDALLEEYARSGEFLGVPAVEQIRRASDVTRDHPDESGHEDHLDLSFLEPPTVEGSLGSLCHYDIQELIGRGGCGIVFKAFDQRLHRIVAIKVMTPAMAVTSPARKRFLREARATAAIRHENVVSIYAVEEAPLPFLVMEYIDGKTLQQLIDETGPLELTTICRLGRMIANGLEAAHLQGLIHRDIKPANILIESGTGQVKLTDFGLARAADDASRSQSGIIAGTPLYMSPEQVQGFKLDQRSDLFSLGSVLYVMCTGRPPFRAPSTLAVLKRVVDEQPREIQEVITEIPDWLVALIHKLHEKEPENRFASAQEVADLLADAPEQAVQKHKSSEATSSDSGEKRRGLLPWMKAAAILIVLLSSFGFTEATGITNLRGTVIRLFSPEGTLVIEVNDPGVSVSIDGQELVITGAGVKELRLKPGQYQLQASKDGKVLQQELVIITRDGRQVVQVSRETAPVASKPTETVKQITAADSKSTDPDRLAAEYVLSMGGKVWINKDSAFTDGNGIQSLAKLPVEPFRLTHAELISNARVTDAGLEAFRGTKHLRGIYLTNSTKVGDAGVANLKENSHLHEIHLWGTKVSGTGLKAFTNCSEVIDFYIGFTRVTNADMPFFRNFAGWKTLRCIMVSGLNISDSGFASLVGAPGLGQIHLEGSKITDAGLLELAKCPKLGLIWAFDTQLTPAGIERFMQARNGKCGIRWEKPGMPPESEGAVVSKEPAAAEVDADFSRVWRLTTMQPRDVSYGWQPGPRHIFVAPQFERCHEYLVVNQLSSITWKVPEGTRSFTATGLYNFGCYVSFNIAFDGKPVFSSGVTRLEKIALNIPAECRSITLSVGRVTENSEFAAGCPVYWLKPRMYNEPLTTANTAPETKTFTKLTALKPIEGEAKISHDGSYQTNPDELTVEPPGFDMLPYCSDLLWAHAPSRQVFDIPEGAQRFRAVGAAYRSRSVRFALKIDGQEVYRSPIAGIVSIDVPLPAGAKQIVLLTDTCGDDRNDWADWCYPRFVGL